MNTEGVETVYAHTYGGNVEKKPKKEKVFLTVLNELERRCKDLETENTRKTCTDTQNEIIALLNILTKARLTPSEKRQTDEVLSRLLLLNIGWLAVGAHIRWIHSELKAELDAAETRKRKRFWRKALG